MTTLFFIMLGVTLVNIYGIYVNRKELRQLRATRLALAASQRTLEVELRRTEEYNGVLAQQIIDKERGKTNESDV